MIFSAHLSMLFRELPYLERPPAAAEAGFTAVETWWPDEPGGAWADEVARRGLAVTAINADGGDLEAGDRGFLNIAAQRDQSVAGFRAAVALAQRCGAPRINVLVGREHAGESRDAQFAHATEVFRECAAIGGEAGLTVLVENINDLDTPGYLVPTPAAAAALIDAVDSPNVRLLYDAYHAARAGCDPCREVAELAPLIGHVQYADCPGRGAPGTGEVDLGAFVRALEDAGYEGAIGLEFDPRGSPVTCTF